MGHYISISVASDPMVSYIIGPLPDYPQTTVDKVASVIELDLDWLSVCL